MSREGLTDDNFQVDLFVGKKSEVAATEIDRALLGSCRVSRCSGGGAAASSSVDSNSSLSVKVVVPFHV